MNVQILGVMEVGAVEAGSSRIDAERGEIDRRCIGQKHWSPTMLALGLALVLGTVGCHKTTAQATSTTADDQNDPADGNMAPLNGGAYAAPAQPVRVQSQSAQNEAQRQAEVYSQQPAPIERRAPYAGDQSYGNQGYNNQSYKDQSGLTDEQAADLYESNLTDEEASEPPPPLPVYEQPPAPSPDYLWTPGYWAWGPGDYYWVPGAWVAAPYVGALWTPGYWDYYGSAYRFHRGFWGLHIGFYGGVNYGFGYFGHGYYGGYWDRDHFRYNTECNRIDRGRIPYFYARNVPENYRRENTRVSFDGGRGGLHVRPLAAEYAVLHERRNAPMESQVRVQREASQNRQQFFNQNRGRPGIAVASRPVVADRTPPAVLPEPTRRLDRLGNRGDMRPGQAQTPGQQGRPQENGQQIRNAHDAARPGQDSHQVQTNGPDRGYRQGPQDVRPNQPQNQGRPWRPQSEARPVQPQPEVRPGQPQPQAIPSQSQPQRGPFRPQSEVRQPAPPQQVLPQQQANPNQPPSQERRFRPQSEMRQPQPQQASPQQQLSQPQANPHQPQSQDRRFRPQSDVRQPQPQPQQAQPQPQPQMMRQTQPQPQARPQEQVRPQQPHPQPQARPSPPAHSDPHQDEKPRG